MGINSNIWIFLGLAICTGAQDVTYRLPMSVNPTHYVVNIDTNLETGTFIGRTIINVLVTQRVNRIVMHSKDLVINALEVDNFPGTTPYLNPANDSLTIYFPQYIAANTNTVIRIDYSGSLGTENVGYYLATYRNELNQERRLAVTHFESTNARRAFPCFDEPYLKATFQISLTRSNNLITASNMQLVQQFTSTNNRMTDVYVTTERMSTYLVAFMVSDYANVMSEIDSISYRTFGRPELIRRGDGDYALGIAPLAIRAMANFTNVPYVLPTMDQIAVPNDYFNLGGMENWGMVTYREMNLMFHENTTTASEKQHITTLISHEFAHQWFGNLVTPVWWNYIWLNEGFATYFEMLVTSQFQPNWQLMDQFITEIVQPALAVDALESTNAMSRQVNSPAEIAAIYDDIVYKKAAAIIRMAASFLGETVFRNGLSEYLRQWEFANVNPQRLYSHWQRALNNPTIAVANILSSWEVQSGYPVVTVTRLSNSTIFTQERFLINRAHHSDRTVWHIPLTWFSNTTTVNQISWITRANTVFSTNLNIPLTHWVVFNINQAGFYRVNYDEANWRLIINYLRSGSFGLIPVINRAQLIDDAFSLARSQRLNLSIALDVGSYIQNETAYVPILTFTKAFSHLERLAIGLDHYRVIQQYGRNALELYFNNTGFIQQTDAHLVKLTKVAVLTWLCRLEHLGCRTNSAQVFQAWITQSTPIQADSQNFVFCNGIRNTTQANWEIALQRYTASREDTQRRRIVEGLGCSNNQVLLQRLLDMLLDPNSAIGRRDRVPAITSIYTNNGVQGVNLVLQWLNRNFTAIYERIGNVPAIINGVTDRITTNEQATLFSTFAEAHAFRFSSVLNSTIADATTNIETNLEFINTTSSHFDDYFDDNNSSTTIYCQIFLIFVCIFVSFI